MLYSLIPKAITQKTPETACPREQNRSEPAPFFATVFYVALSSCCIGENVRSNKTQTPTNRMANKPRSVYRTARGDMIPVFQGKWGWSLFVYAIQYIRSFGNASRKRVFPVFSGFRCAISVLVRHCIKKVVRQNGAIG